MKVKRRHEKHKHTENHIAISHGVGVVVRMNYKRRKGMGVGGL